jgi:hypothetical protein
VLFYLWLDVSGEREALRHRVEIEHFGEGLKCDGIDFLAPDLSRSLRETPRM